MPTDQQLAAEDRAVLRGQYDIWRALLHDSGDKTFEIPRQSIRLAVSLGAIALEELKAVKEENERLRKRLKQMEGSDD